MPPELSAAAVAGRRRAPARPSLQQLQSNLEALGLEGEQQQQQH
jgi:hypothetical protein